LGFVFTGWLIVAACDAYDSKLIDRPAGSKQTNVGSGADACKHAADLSICGRAHADGVCIDHECKIVRCRSGYFDCDTDSSTGCEATLDSLEHCGACGAACALAHVANNRCNADSADGPCVIDHGCPADTKDGEAPCVSDAPENGCEPGFSDCDGMAANGCETSLRTLSDCGACGVKCALGTAEASCESGSCESIGCAKGFDDCGSGRCTSLANDPMHCGACGTVCGTDAPLCSGGRCTSSGCIPSRGDCDDNPENGCEADLTSVASCGSCNIHCGPYPHATAGCSNARCGIESCDPGFQNCDGQLDNGCETDATQLSSCGECKNDCGSLPHVTAAECDGTRCTQLKCESGWDDCDGDPRNGCEQPLNTADHCGTCDAGCGPAHATGSCQTGKCVISACAQGYDDCDGKVDDGCEAKLDDSKSCGACGNVCGAGSICNGGGCSCNGACADGTQCCSNACVDTQSACFPWPCIPGTARDRNNCGGCGVACITWCCAA
jgi:hypothetical protein